ncbi:Hypothetical_protein [Hexamita inflata]|uniref:Hypothetical_protein n=1 Tax=Hexamita inflata TaxID=28002 RepID=A0AA86QJR4_9EUKA|nr:Hypothetical protein HINF_LOCUS48439 [Hexamita inflata]
MFPKYLQTCRPCKHVKSIYFPYASRQSVGYHIYHQRSQHQIVLYTYLDFQWLFALEGLQHFYQNFQLSPLILEPVEGLIIIHQDALGNIVPILENKQPQMDEKLNFQQVLV